MLDSVTLFPYAYCAINLVCVVQRGLSISTENVVFCNILREICQNDFKCGSIYRINFL